MDKGIDWQALIEFVVVVAGVIGSYVAVKLEVRYLNKELTRVELEAAAENKRLELELSKLEAKHDEMNSKIVEKLSAIERALARIQGRLEIGGDKGGA